MMQEKTGGAAVLAAPGAAETPTWQARAVGEYERSLPDRRDDLRAELAARVLTLTGRRLLPEDLYTDPEGRLAVAGVDGVTFQLYGRDELGDELVMVRPCAYCRTGRFESPQISGSADLGYALSAWEPLHGDCEELLSAEDLADW